MSSKKQFKDTMKELVDSYSPTEPVIAEPEQENVEGNVPPLKRIIVGEKRALQENLRDQLDRMTTRYLQQNMMNAGSTSNTNPISNQTTQPIQLSNIQASLDLVNDAEQNNVHLAQNFYPTEESNFYQQGILPTQADIKTDGDSYKEIEALFKLADELQDKCSEQYRRIDRMYDIITVFIVTVIFLIVLLTIDPKAIDFIKQTESTVAKVILLIGGYLMVFVLMAVRQIRRAKEKIKPEEITLSAILELIRETEGIIAYKNNVSPLQRASFKIRVSKYSTRY